MIASLLAQNFANTLNREPDIVNIVMALIFKESFFNVAAAGPVLSSTNSSTARAYQGYSAIKAALAGASPQVTANINQGLRAWGMMQCMGLNVVRGAGPAGKCEIEVARPDLAGQLLVNPGDSISAKYQGQANINNQLLAGLVILESKYKIVKGSGNACTVGKMTFGSKIAATVAAYLGLGSHDTATGITPQSYSDSICYGSAYQTANGSSSGYTHSTNPTPQQAQAGPPITKASGNNQVPTGC
jgi:hypothetical protein